MLNHVMACFKCPSKVVITTNKENKKFLWGKASPSTWRDVCLPKSIGGGMGIRNVGHFLTMFIWPSLLRRLMKIVGGCKL